jgi:hypothetical protein
MLPRTKGKRSQLPVARRLFQNGGVSSSIDKLAKLVEHHPLFHSRLEGMLKEPEVSAAIQKEKNEDSCLLYKV